MDALTKRDMKNLWLIFFLEKFQYLSRNGESIWYQSKFAYQLMMLKQIQQIFEQNGLNSKQVYIGNMNNIIFIVYHKLSNKFQCKCLHHIKVCLFSYYPCSTFILIWVIVCLHLANHIANNTWWLCWFLLSWHFRTHLYINWRWIV